MHFSVADAGSGTMTQNNSMGGFSSGATRHVVLAEDLIESSISFSFKGRVDLHCTVSLSPPAPSMAWHSLKEPSTYASKQVLRELSFHRL